MVDAGDLTLIDGLASIKPWLELPGDNAPTAWALAKRIELVGGRCNYRRLSALLSTAGISARRRGGIYGYDRKEILAGLAEGGALQELAELTRAALAREYAADGEV